MALEYVVPEYSRREVEAASKALTGRLTDVEEAAGIFRIAHNWRDAHVFPMRRVRAELSGAVRRSKATSVTVARLKRMKSIRKKLLKSPRTLIQMQDIGGCRAIVESLVQLRSVGSLYESCFSQHELLRQWDYIAQPKPDGYRSQHLSMKFSGAGEEEIYSGLRIEIQLRTRTQHAWATAVEAAGSARGEDLKGGEGDPSWLRLFALVSSEIAILEDCPGVPGIAENEKERRDELRDINARLNAAANLTNWNNAVRATERIPPSLSKFYVVQYDPFTQSVTVEPSTRITHSSERLIQEESAHQGRDTVMVELEKAEDLRQAYPNYFLDVSVFTALLRGLIANHRTSQLLPAVAPIGPSAPGASPRPRFVWNWNFGRWKDSR